MSDIITAGEIIKAGGLVAFPTETVYGLGADAFNPQAVARIYSAKGRPGDNPLILHVASAEKFLELAHDPPPYALALIKAYWPGAITLVVKKKPHLPHWLGGHPTGQTCTIGIRMPAHTVARAIIESSGCVVAAPSANKAGTPSPTNASHVADDFPGSEIDLIVDGGSVSVGLESTVVDATGTAPIILRPGAITSDMICRATGLQTAAFKPHSVVAPRSPGMKYRHYAPKAPMTIISGSPQAVAAHILKKCESGKKTGVLTNYPELFPKTAEILPLGKSPEDIAQNLFAHLRRFDKLGVHQIYAMAVCDTGLGAAIMDRMLKAAEGRIIHVE